jgi:hypothetical protein
MENKPMTGNFRAIKIWAFITVCSFFTYSLYFFINTLQYTWQTYNLGARDPYLYRLTSSIGVTFRLLGAILAMISIYLIWRYKTNSFPKVKNIISAALLFEGIYYLSFLPSIPRLIYFGNFISLALSYSLQISLTFPLLTILSLKMMTTSEDNSVNTGLLKWIAAASVGYIAALWTNNVLRWFDMVWAFGIEFVLAGVTYFGFFNGILILTLSMIFALAGFFSIIKKGNINTKLWGLSLIMAGIHFLLYLIYSIYVDALSYALLNEIWTVPLIGLGLTVLKLKD